MENYLLTKSISDELLVDASFSDPILSVALIRFEYKQIKNQNE